MASIRTAQPTAALVIIGSIQTTVVISDAACSTPSTKQWLIIPIYGMTSYDLIFWNRAMASKRTAKSATALLVIGSVQLAIVIREAACGKPGTRQWLIILIFRRAGRIVDFWTGKVRMAEIKLGPVQSESARWIGLQP